MPYNEDGTYREPDNTDRAGWAREAVQTFADSTRSTPGDRDLTDEENLHEVAGDLLGDLLHLLGEEAFANCLERARGYYADELADEEEVADLH
jgi:hypothetical protein